MLTVADAKLGKLLCRGERVMKQSMGAKLHLKFFGCNETDDVTYEVIKDNKRETKTMKFGKQKTLSKIAKELEQIEHTTELIAIYPTAVLS